MSPDAEESEFEFELSLLEDGSDFIPDWEIPDVGITEADLPY